MPIKRCATRGKKGFKAGPTGKCFMAKSKAMSQLRAIKISQRKRKSSK